METDRNTSHHDDGTRNNMAIEEQYCFVLASRSVRRLFIYLFIYCPIYMLRAEGFESARCPLNCHCPNQQASVCVCLFCFVFCLLLPSVEGRMYLLPVPGCVVINLCRCPHIEVKSHPRGSVIWTVNSSPWQRQCVWWWWCGGREGGVTCASSGPCL